MKRRPLVDLDAIEREVRQRELAEREHYARRLLASVEISVLHAMLTRYEFEPFADVELEDFFDPRHRAVFAAIRALEHQGRHVDGEFLRADVVGEIERTDRELDKHVRDHVTDEALRGLYEPPAYVVRIPDRVALYFAIRQLKAAHVCRRENAVATLEAMTAMEARE